MARFGRLAGIWGMLTYAWHSDFCQLGMHDLPTSSHLQGMLLLFFVIVFPSSLYLSALQILGLSDIRLVTL